MRPCLALAMLAVVFAPGQLDRSPLAEPTALAAAVLAPTSGPDVAVTTAQDEARAQGLFRQRALPAAAVLVAGVVIGTSPIPVWSVTHTPPLVELRRLSFLRRRGPPPLLV